MTIDVHAHIYPKVYLDILESHGQILRDKTTGTSLINETGKDTGLKFPIFPDMWDLEARVKSMQKLGIDVQVISIGNPWVSYMPANKSKDIARKLNVELQRIVREHQKFFVGMGVLPVDSPVDAAEEIRFAVRELGLKGFMIGTHVNGKSIASEEFLPFFEEAAKEDVPIYIHPLAPMNIESYDLLSMTALIFPTLTAVAALGIVLNGHLDRYPRAKIILAHLGGTVPFCLGRLDRAVETLGKKKLPKTANEYLRRFYLDSVSYFGPTLEYATNLWGSEKIMLGTDYPYAWSDNFKRVLEIIEKSRFSDKEKSYILGENASRLFF